MKKLMYVMTVLFISVILFNSCEEKKTDNEEAVEEVQEVGAEVKTDSIDSAKSELEAQDQEVKNNEEGESSIVEEGEQTNA